MKAKKILSVLLAAVLLCGLFAGCAKKNDVKIYNLQKKMCSYASENDSECIAECICDFVTNGYKACELSQLVVKFFREEL